jgi:uncharacterized protein (DUF1697 family)
MTTYVAFLRGINVGGHRVAMTDLAAWTDEVAGVSDAVTYIASGNVAFSSRARDTAALEAKLEKVYAARMGFEAPTFVRSAAELARLAEHEPFRDHVAGEGKETLQVVFLKSPLPTAVRREVAALSNDADRLTVDGRELWWLTRGGVSDTTVHAPTLGRLLGVTTARNVNTVRKLAAKHSA